MAEGTYRCSAPLIRPSRLTTKDNGGVGKNLSEGWNLNFAVGCTHACPFCYVDSIHKRFGNGRYGNIVQNKWGDYFLVPENLEDAIRRTPWHRWAGKEVMMSSTHDPYLPKLSSAARTILEHALPSGVRVCLQTRSFIVTQDLDLLAEYEDQVRLQVSIATMNKDLSRKIEPRVPTPEARLEVLRRAKSKGLSVGVILAPIFPPTSTRPDFVEDLREIAVRLKEIGPNHIYGESLHLRGENLRLVENALDEEVFLGRGLDRAIERAFHSELAQVGLQGTWWPE
ncbi:MAG: radical SAM protein [Thermoplasmata archaeon]